MSQRTKSRYKYMKTVRTKGKISLTNYFQKFEIGAKAALVAEPAIHEGQFPARFYGRVGSVVGMQGKCYMVEVRDGGMKKKFIVHPSHMKKVEN